MLNRIFEGDKFKNPLTGTIFKVKKIYKNTVLLGDVEDQDHQLITEIVTLFSFYQKVNKQ